MGLRAFRESDCQPGSSARTGSSHALAATGGPWRRLHGRRRPERVGQVERRAGRADPPAPSRGAAPAASRRCSRARSPSPSSRPPSTAAPPTGSARRITQLRASEARAPRRGARAARRRRPALLLVVDQFEELFTLVGARRGRRRSSARSSRGGRGPGQARARAGDDARRLLRPAARRSSPRARSSPRTSSTSSRWDPTSSRRPPRSRPASSTSWSSLGSSAG